MTVAELRKALEGLPDDMLVVYSSDVVFNAPWDAKALPFIFYDESDTQHLSVGIEDSSGNAPLALVIS